jgi:hypothetical protein
MANSVAYTSLIKQLITEHMHDLSTTDTVEARAVFDDDHGEYLLLHIGWKGISRVQTIALHISLQDERVHIERDALPPPGAAMALREQGVPKDLIVLSFLHPEEREYSDFAVA